MPYRTEYIEPEPLMRYLGVTIYPAWTDDEEDGGPCEHIFATDVCANDGFNRFDIRELPIPAGERVAINAMQIPRELKDILKFKRAIEMRLLQPSAETGGCAVFVRDPQELPYTAEAIREHPGQLWISAQLLTKWKDELDLSWSDFGVWLDRILRCSPELPQS